MTINNITSTPDPAAHTNTASALLLLNPDLVRGWPCELPLETLSLQIGAYWLIEPFKLQRVTGNESLECLIGKLIP